MPAPSRRKPRTRPSASPVGSGHGPRRSANHRLLLLPRPAQFNPIAPTQALSHARLSHCQERQLAFWRPEITGINGGGATSDRPEDARRFGSFGRVRTRSVRKRECFGGGWNPDRPVRRHCHRQLALIPRALNPTGCLWRGGDGNEGKEPVRLLRIAPAHRRIYFEEFGPCRHIDVAFDQVVDRFAARMCVRRDPECRAHPLCQGSCPLLYFSSISQVGGIGQ